MPILGLAIGYYLIGRLALLLAIPPGYATAVWPAAGLALAGLLRYGYRAWPGIVLGSFSINFPTALQGGSEVLPAAAVAISVGLGAALQAATGALLIRRSVEGPAALGRTDQIGAMLLLGGPIACLVNASIGVLTLWTSGTITRVDVGFHWLTWWVGDTIGVLTVLPLFLAWAASPAQLSRRNKIFASVPVVILLVLVTFLFVRASALEQRRIETEFAQRSERVAQALARRFAEYIEALHAVASFHSAAGIDIDRDEFRELVADTLVRHPGLHALSWSPRVPDARRAAYEHAIAQEGYPDFRIRELDASGELVTAARRAEYFPVTFIEPLARNAAALGFDLASDQERRAALLRAHRSGKPTASRWLDLVQAEAGGVVVVLPAYGPGLAQATPGRRTPTLRGYASAVLQIDGMMAVFLRDIELEQMQLRLLDATTPPARRLLYATPAAARQDGSVPARQSVRAAPLAHSVELDIGGREWRLLVTQAPGYAATNRSWVAWGMLATAMLLTGLFSALLLVTVGRTAAVRAEVKLRTAELEQANAALEVSIAGHALTEDALRASEDQARSIIDTARDAYVAIDEHSRILEWNREAERIFGWTRDEAVGRLLPDTLIPERYRQLHAHGVAQFVATGEGLVINKRLELSAMHRDGHELPVELTIWPTQHATSYRFNAFLHDISERQRAVQCLVAQEGAAETLVESATLAEAGPKVLRAICSALGWRAGALWMVDAESNLLHCAQFWHEAGRPVPAFEAISLGTTFPPGVGLPGRVWSSGKPVWIPDVTLDSNFPRASHAAEDDLHAAFGFPIISSSEVLGVAEFFSGSIEPPDEGLLKMMDTLGNLLGQFVARTRAEAELFGEKERAEVTLRSIGDGVIVIDTTGLVSYINPAAESMCGWEAAEALGRPVQEVLQIIDPESGESTLSPLLMALRENRTFGIAGNSELVRRDGFRAAIEDSAAPIHDRDGQVVGSVMVFHDVSDSRAMALKMSHLAQHDYLTDLPNRVLLQDRFLQAIERAKRENLNVALLYMDLDGFKHINDSLGHEVGDLLLQEVAHRLLHSVRGVDTVSRQGGDEFVVLLPEIRSTSDAARVAHNILEAVRHPFRIAGTEHNITMSIGISLYPDDDRDPGVLRKFADAAMYQAKQMGRNQYRFYTRAISERADRRLLIESSLHQALRNHEFVLHYQPKVSFEDGRITGMEALVRWMRPSGELLAPDEFIEIAEECGLIARIDLWVLEEACRQNRAWQDDGLAQLPISVNLSAASANVERFPRHLKTVLARTGLDPACLQIEITESQMLDDTDRFETLIRGIKAVGVKVAIDDFGTGYSSLGYLYRFPFDVLKIDRTFVNALEVDSRQLAIVQAITHLAHALGYRVVAEGVETVEQARLLHAHGCHEMQGYLYSRPLPAAQFEGLLRDRRIDIATQAGSP